MEDGEPGVLWSSQRPNPSRGPLSSPALRPAKAILALFSECTYLGE